MKVLEIVLGVYILVANVLEGGCLIRKRVNGHRNVRPLSIVKSRSSVCTTQACLDYSNMVQNNIDKSVDPCEDFYKFSCGRYVEQSVIKPEYNEASQFQMLENKINNELSDLLSAKILPSDDNWVRNAKKFYSSCIHLNKLEAFTEQFAKEFLRKELGGWPMMTGEDNPYSSLELLKRMNKYGFLDFVVISVIPNPKDPTSNIIKISQLDPTERDPYDYYIQEDYAEAYKAYFKTVLEYLNKDRVPLDEEINDIFELDKKLAKAQMTPSEIRNATINIEMTLGELQNKIPKFPWKEFIMHGMFEDIDGVKINEDEPISIDNWDFLIKMQDIYWEYSTKRTRVFQNYLIGAFFENLINNYLPIKYLTAKLGLQKITSGIVSLPKRDYFCIAQEQNILLSEIGKIYVDRYFGKKNKQDALEMTNNILNEFKEMLNENTWMDPVSKENAIEKARFLNPQIGYPDYFDDAAYVDKNYDYVLNSNNLLENILTIFEYVQKVEVLSTLRQKVDRDKWSFTTPAAVNAFYDPSTNQIYFPAAILSFPLFDSSLPHYINYGAIGIIIGHEITHGFDDLGRKYDKHGRFFSDEQEGLWTQKTIESFKRKSRCIINQYSSYYIPEINRTLNGFQTLNENIADVGGLKQAFRAYKKWVAQRSEEKLPNLDFTQEQLFFISSAQVWCSKIRTEKLLNDVLSDYHSISSCRVKGIIENSEDFYEVFHCKNKPSKTCSMW